MKNSRCPYHVKQGIIDAQGKIISSDVCGIRTACGAACPIAPFTTESHKKCARFVTFTQGTDRQVLFPKNEIEFLPELNSVESFSEIELL